MSYTGDWTDWAGDNPEEAEAQLHAGSPAAALGLSPAGIDATDPNEAACEHEVTDNQGVCLDCEEPIEGFEPTDAQIPGSYDIRKAAA